MHLTKSFSFQRIKKSELSFIVQRDSFTLVPRHGETFFVFLSRELFLSRGGSTSSAPLRNLYFSTSRLWFFCSGSRLSVTLHGLRRERWWNVRRGSRLSHETSSTFVPGWRHNDSNLLTLQAVFADQTKVLTALTSRVRDLQFTSI